MSLNDALRAALAGTEEEFPFIEGLESGNRFEDLGSGLGFLHWLPAAQQEWEAAFARRYQENLERLRRLPKVESENLELPGETRNFARSMANFIEQTTKAKPPVPAGGRWPLPWPVHHFVWQAPEGSGKSSIVPELVARGFTVVFCSKSNAQLHEQEAGFRARWPELRIHRYVSKAAYLNEELKQIGIDFKPVYYPARTPYSGEGVDEPSTRQALRHALDGAGYSHLDHVLLFDKLFLQHRSPPVVGKDVDVVLLTLAAFRAFCTARHRPWWHALGLMKGEKSIIVEGDSDFHSNPIHREVKRVVASDVPIPKFNEHGQRQRTLELGLDKIIVIIDDPDRTEFDSRRLIEDEHVADIYRKSKALPAYQEQWIYIDHWLKLGYPPLLSERLAKEWQDKAYEHQIATFQERQFEERPPSTVLGYGLRRGFSARSGLAPKILITTTEHITARLARQSLGGAMRWGRTHIDRYGKQDLSPATPYCHVTLLATKLVRKANKALLLIIEGKLKSEFPEADIVLIADSLACELNLLNNKGRNDLADRSTIIKLSIPNPSVALNLWAQFPGSTKPGVLNTILLADLANQAIGRNQGNRFKGKPCILLVDPMYATMLVKSDLLRYRCTPWSFHKPLPTAMQFHGGLTPLEERVTQLLEPGIAARLAMGVFGLELGAQMSDAQWAIYEEWLNRNNFVIPKGLRRS